MAIIYLPYLFDEKPFYELISPIIPQLEQGDFQPLLELAKETLAKNPQLWDTLNKLNMGYTFAEESEVQDPNSLLMKVIVQFLDPIKIPEPNAWRVLEPALPLLGWEEVDTKIMLFGSSLCTLLIPQKSYNPKEYFGLSAYKDAEKPWCEGSVGWVDHTLITRYRNQLMESKSHFLRFSSQPPESLIDEFRNYNDFSMEWLSRRMIESYDYTLQIFDFAYENQKSLVLGIA